MAKKGANSFFGGGMLRAQSEAFSFSFAVFLCCSMPRFQESQL